HVERDLLEPRSLHDGLEAELVLQLPSQLLLVEHLQPRPVVGGGARAVLAWAGLLSDLPDSWAQRSISWPQSTRLHTRTFTCSPCDSRSLIPTRVGRLQTGQTTMTLPTGSGAGFSITPPGVIAAPPMRLVFCIGRGFVCRFTMLMFSTMTLPSFGRASMTWPCFPRSLPVRTWTRSPLRMRIVCISGSSGDIGGCLG